MRAEHQVEEPRDHRSGNKAAHQSSWTSKKGSLIPDNATNVDDHRGNVFRSPESKNHKVDAFHNKENSCHLASHGTGTFYRSLFLEVASLDADDIQGKAVDADHARDNQVHDDNQERATFLGDHHSPCQAVEVTLTTSAT